MAALLFEGQEDLKIYTANLANNTVRIRVTNYATDATNIYTEHDLSLEDLTLLKDWIYEQIRSIEKNTK